MAKRFITGLRIIKPQLDYVTLQVEDNQHNIYAADRQVINIDDAAWEDVDAIAGSVKEQFGEFHGAVSLGIPLSNLLLHTVRLPTVDMDELSNMVELQIDKFSPFAEDKRAWSYEILKTGSKESWVLIATMHKAKLEFLGDVCRRAGLPLARIDIDAMGWWHLLKLHNVIISEHRQIIIIREETSAIIFGIENSLPLMFKNLNYNRNLSGENNISETMQELNSLVLSMNMEYGEKSISRIDCWTAEAEDSNFVKYFKTEYPDNHRYNSLSDLPGVCEGLALRMIKPPFTPITKHNYSGKNNVIDLFPVQWRVELAAFSFKRNLMIIMLSIMLVWIVGMGLFLGFYNYKQKQISDLKQNAQTLEKPAKKVKNLRKQVVSYTHYLDRTHSALECLREITLALPDEIEITSFQFSKADHILLQGETLSVNSVYMFKETLDKSDLFDSVELGSIQPVKRKNKTIQTFQMNIILPGREVK
jgi:Tfp pilus assembly PilM family ATPase/Tfp pilus assembly protein PilN